MKIEHRLIEKTPFGIQETYVTDAWEDIRKKHFYNQVFPTLDEVEDVLC